MDKQILTAKEACTYLGVSYWTLLNKLVKEIPHIRTGKRGNIRFRKSTLDRYLDDQENKSKECLEKTDFIFNRRDESIEVLREKYKKRNQGKSIEEIMQTVRRMR